MRLMIALLSILTMMASPAMAGASLARYCPFMDGAAPEVGAMADHAAAMPCCDPGAKQSRDAKGCAAACATVIPAAAAITPAPLVQMVGFAPVIFANLARIRPRASDPSGLKRPPKRLI